MNVNAFMDDSTDKYEKLAMMDQNIEQVMNKLEAFTRRESSCVPTCTYSFDQPKKDVEESLTKSKFKKEKQSASVSALSVQQLQDMITNTIRLNMVEKHNVLCITPSHILDGLIVYPCRQTINHQSNKILLARGTQDNISLTLMKLVAMLEHMVNFL